MFGTIRLRIINGKVYQSLIWYVVVKNKRQEVRNAAMLIGSPIYCSAKFERIIRNEN